MIPLPTMSGTEFVQVLLQLGFRVEKANDVATVLTRGGRRVVVRPEPALSVEAVALLVLAAGVDWIELATVLIPEPVDASSTRTIASAGLLAKKSARGERA